MFNLKLKALNRFKTAKKILYLNKKRVCAQTHVVHNEKNDEIHSKDT